MTFEHKEYWIEYYDKHGRRYNSVYYPTRTLAEENASSLRDKDFVDVKIIEFRY